MFLFVIYYIFNFIWTQVSIDLSTLDVTLAVYIYICNYNFITFYDRFCFICYGLVSRPLNQVIYFLLNSYYDMKRNEMKLINLRLESTEMILNETKLDEISLSKVVVIY